MSKWEKKDSSWYQAYFSNNASLHVRLNGDFLVNRQPAGKLPKEIKENFLYQRYFGYKTDFKVFPSITSGEFCTSDFNFLLIDNQLVIKNRKNINCSYRQLLPHTLFESNFPINFSENFSHWLVKEKNEIEFCSKTYEENLNDNYQVYFIYDLNRNLLLDFFTHKHLISIHSQTFIEIELKFTRKLESKEYVHIYEDSNKNLIKIELPRMKLNFYLDENLNILSKEYSGFKVNLNQNIGTLLNLETFLVLCDEKNFYDEKPKGLVLIPNRELIIGKTNTNLKTVNIIYDVPRFPQFFAYEIDWRLHRLKAGESIEAWLYLALLHAVTSQVLPDPFTG